MKKLLVLLMIAFVSGAVISIALADSWRFAVTDDSRAVASDNNSEGVAANTLRILVKDIKNQSVDFVIFPGDMVTGETNNTSRLNEMMDSWNAIVKLPYDDGIPIYTVRGNHEYNPLAKGAKNPADPSNGAYLRHFTLPLIATSIDGGFTYTFTHKNARFFGFDQYINRQSSFNNTLYTPHSNKGQMMNSWVTAQINNSTSSLNFAFAHEPLFPSKSHPDDMANDPESRDALVEALSNHHGAYFCGHDHMYLRGTISNGRGQIVPELVIGTAGGGNYNYAPFNVTGYTGPNTFTVDKNYGNSSRPIFGYLLITVYDNNTWIGEFRGFQYDTFSAGKPLNSGPIEIMDSFKR